MKKLVYACLALAVAFASCQVNYEKTKSGLKYKIYEGKGAKLQAGQFIKFNIEYTIEKNGKDSVMNTTYGKMPGYTMIDTSARTAYSFLEILPKAKVGDSIIFVMSVDSLKNKGMIPAYDSLFVRGGQIKGKVKIMQSYTTEQAVMKDVEVERLATKGKEIAAIEAYLKKNNINAQKTKNGVYIQITSQGTGEKIDSGNYVSVNYKGYLLDNKKVFDSNTDPAFGHMEPYSLTVGAMEAISGWDEALPYFTKGAKGTVFIPSSMGYGEQGRPPVIPPFSNLVFEMRIMDVKPTAPAPSPLPNTPPQQPGR